MVENNSLSEAMIHLLVFIPVEAWDKTCHAYFITTPWTCVTSICLHVQEPQPNCTEEFSYPDTEMLEIKTNKQKEIELYTKMLKKFSGYPQITSG